MQEHDKVTVGGRAWIGWSQLPASAQQLILERLEAVAHTQEWEITDTWIKQNSQWKCVASQSTLIQ